MFRRTGMIRVCVFIVLLMNINFLSAQVLTASVNSEEGTVLYKRVQVFMDELGDKIDVEFNIVARPNDRAVAELVAGTIDLDIGRTIYAYSDFDPVIYTTYPVLVMKYFFISANQSIKPDDPSTWANLELVTTRGNQLIQDWMLKSNIGFGKVFWVRDIENIKEVLLAGRADYAVTGAVQISSWMQDPLFAASGIKILEPPAFLSPTYIVLSEKHRDLVEPLSQAIREMAESGRTQEIFSPAK